MTNVKQFKDSIGFVSKAMGNGDPRDFLNGIVFEKDRILASDGHRLHIQKYDHLGFSGPEQDLFLSAAEVKKILAWKTGRNPYGKDAEVSVKKFKNKIEFTYKGKTATAITPKEAFDGELPDYSMIIPRESTYQFKMQFHTQCIDAFKFMSANIWSSAKITVSENGLRFTLRPHMQKGLDFEISGDLGIDFEFEVSCINGASWSNEETKPTYFVRESYKPLEFGVRPQYWLDALRFMSGLTFYYIDPLSPQVLDDGIRKAIIMPVRV